jgi:sugar O-acyltransferase (sialic acid O-acetyltransferase NeuD family)
MIIAGANRHAKEVLDVLEKNGIHKISFFDDWCQEIPTFFKSYHFIRTVDKLVEHFVNTNNQFVLGLGNPNNRFMIQKKMIESGGVLTSMISSKADIGQRDVVIGEGVNIMAFAYIGNSSIIGNSSLINCHSSIHHDAMVGEFSEVSPHACLLGGSQIGDFTSVGSHAVIFPDIKVGSNCQIGAGSVVRMNIPDNSLVYGVPGKIIHKW